MLRRRFASCGVLPLLIASVGVMAAPVHAQNVEPAIASPAPAPPTRRRAKPPAPAAEPRPEAPPAPPPVRAAPKSEAAPAAGPLRPVASTAPAPAPRPAVTITTPSAPPPALEPAVRPMGPPEPPPIPVQPPRAEPLAAATPTATTATTTTEPADDPDSPTPPPAPNKPGDYAGTSDVVEEGDDSLSNDTDEEPEAQYREEVEREFSVRIDPLNWLLLGRLGIELEMTAWKFISVELIPVFVTSTEPILLNYSRFDNTLTQHSRGIGPISGASLGAGFWLFGEPFSGYVIRLNFTNYAYTYKAADGGGTFDKVEFTERRLNLFFGSHSRFGPFTIAGGFGLGIELNAHDRCALDRDGSGSSIEITGRTSDCEGRQLIALNRTLTETADLNGPLHPVYFEARFSFGVVF